MESGTEDRHPNSPSMEQPTDQTPSQQDSFEEKSSDVEEKLSEGKGKIVSSQLQQNSVEERGSDGEEKRSEEKGKTFSFHLDSHVQRPDRNLSCWSGVERRNGIRDI